MSEKQCFLKYFYNSFGAAYDGSQINGKLCLFDLSKGVSDCWWSAGFYLFIFKIIINRFVVNYSKPYDLWDTSQVTKAQKFGGLSQKLSPFERKKEKTM